MGGGALKPTCTSYSGWNRVHEVTINLEGKDKITQHFGFRWISMVDGRILLNGLPIFMHGLPYILIWFKQELMVQTFFALQDP